MKVSKNRRIERNKQNKESTTISQLTTHVQNSTHVAQWLLPQYAIYIQHHLLG